MHEFPPNATSWEVWLCPVVFLSTMVATAAMLLRRSVQPVARTAGFAIIVSATLWFVLMLPRIQGAREAAPRTECKNNLKQIVRAVHAYHDSHGVLPAPSVAEASGPPVSWRIDLLPLFDPGVQAPSPVDYVRERSWNEEANLPPSRRRLLRYVCPSNRSASQDSLGRWYTAYAMVTGPGTPFPAEGPLTIDQVTDGTSQTALVVEACGQNIVWTEPRDVDVSQQAMQINAPGDSAGTSEGLLSSYHDAGAHCALADGSVRFLSDRISEDVIRALTTAAAQDDAGEY
jgi:DNA-binding transcriptional regulator YdaS (Cro superfamily)